jgi:hypothetical protein
MNEFLFLPKGELSNYLVELEQQAERLVDQMPEDELLAVPPDSDTPLLFSQLLPQVPTLLLNRVTPKRETLAGGGSAMRFYVPFCRSPLTIYTEAANRDASAR